jgi:hypothetical protein
MVLVIYLLQISTFSIPVATFAMSFLIKNPFTTESRVEGNRAPTEGEDTGLQKELATVDEILAKKMASVNSAIDEIGMTPFQWKLFFLNGFGYAVDSVYLSLATD